MSSTDRQQQLKCDRAKTGRTENEMDNRCPTNITQVDALVNATPTLVKAARDDIIENRNDVWANRPGTHGADPIVPGSWLDKNQKEEATTEASGSARPHGNVLGGQRRRVGRTHR